MGAVAFEHLGMSILAHLKSRWLCCVTASQRSARSRSAGVDFSCRDRSKAPASFDPSNAQAVAVLILSDIIRQNAEETLAYLADQGIDLKVISGDNPIAVAAIAHRAGLANADQAIDLSTLTTEAEVREAATRYTVFGRDP